MTTWSSSSRCRDPNVIYVFHFYEPHIFTHQGATWGAYYWHWLKGLHYPSNAGECGAGRDAVPEARDRMQVIRYGQDHWDASRIEAEINQAADWAKQRGVPLICNEFGVFRDFSEPQDRIAWIKDVRTSLERHNIGWAMWDYSGNFGVVTQKDGKATLDEVDGASSRLEHAREPLRPIKLPEPIDHYGCLTDHYRVLSPRLRLEPPHREVVHARSRAPHQALRVAAGSAGFVIHACVPVKCWDASAPTVPARAQR